MLQGEPERVQGWESKAGDIAEELVVVLERRLGGSISPGVARIQLRNVCSWPAACLWACAWNCMLLPAAAALRYY